MKANLTTAVAQRGATRAPDVAGGLRRSLARRLVPLGWGIASLACFIGIWWWAFARRNQARFDEAAQLPFEQD